MPTFRKVTIPEMEYRRDTPGKEIGKFKVSIIPTGIRKRLSIYHHEISQYFAGSCPRFQVNIEHEGNDNPFHFSIWEIQPRNQLVFSERDIVEKKHSKVFEMPYLDSSGEHIYAIRVYSGLDSSESEIVVIRFRALDFDTIIVYLGISALSTIFAGIAGYVIGRFTAS